MAQPWSGGEAPRLGCLWSLRKGAVCEAGRGHSAAEGGKQSCGAHGESSPVAGLP